MDGRPLANKIRAFARKYPERIAKAIAAEAEIEMAESKRRCPVSPLPAPKGVVPGTLRASGQVHQVQQDGKYVEVTMSYGGAAQDYAVVQHENLDFFHTTGQAKYLESVLNESRPYMVRRIAKRVRLDEKER